MNKEASKAVIVALVDSSLGINDHLVLLDIVILIIGGLDQSFVLVLVFSVLLELFLNVLFLVEASKYDRLDAEHQRDCDDHAQ